MTEIRPCLIIKVVGALAYQWAVVGTSPFAVELFLLVVGVVGGKGGAMMMVVGWSSRRGRS